MCVSTDVNLRIQAPQILRTAIILHNWYPKHATQPSYLKAFFAEYSGGIQLFPAHTQQRVEAMM